MQSRPKGPGVPKLQNSAPWELSDTFFCLTCRPKLDMVIKIMDKDIMVGHTVIFTLSTNKCKNQGDC